MSKYTYTMALATINECHNRECQAGHWIAAGITGQLHSDFVAIADRPPVTIPTVEDIRATVTRYIRRLGFGRNATGLYVQLWVNECTDEWGFRPEIDLVAPLPADCAWAGMYIFSDSHPGDTCRALLKDLRDEVGITEVDDGHPLLRDLRSERDPKAVEALRASLSR